MKIKNGKRYIVVKGKDGSPYLAFPGRQTTKEKEHRLKAWLKKNKLRVRL